MTEETNIQNSDNINNNEDQIDKSLNEDVSKLKKEKEVQDDVNRENFKIPEGISDYAKKLIYEYSIPAVASSLESEDKLWETVKGDYINKYKEEDKAKEPMAGDLFMIKTEVVGLPEPYFAG